MRESPWKKLTRDLRESGEKPYLEMLRGRLDVEQTQEGLEREIAREMASALGRAGEKVLDALRRLASIERELDACLEDAPERADLLERYRACRRAALQARHELRIHREAIGIRRNDVLERTYPVPRARR
jgi:hypothetical protein